MIDFSKCKTTKDYEHVSRVWKPNLAGWADANESTAF